MSSVFRWIRRMPARTFFDWVPACAGMTWARATGIAIIIGFSPALSFAQENGAGVIELPGYSLKYSVQTSAGKSTIWRLWRDVENWKKFDTRLEYSYLDEGKNFQSGATGYIKATGAPKTRFEIVNLEEQVSFIERLHLPFHQTIDMQRYFEVDEQGTTTFSHEINFTGALSPVLYLFLCGTFKKELVLVMTHLKALAESQEPPPAQTNEAARR
ncbi:MAG: hypothetical protein RQ899_01055 [Pseudomonadales bacterium]|nr:hypothetical protein [Pseudomonadales bacterium]